MDAMDTSASSTDGLDAELEAFLGSCAREDAYRVERVLKRAPHETTELVYFSPSANGDADATQTPELGPFVRKVIDLSSGTGGAYETLFCAQREGRRFVHLPRVLECRREGEKLTVVMEYVAGETLGEYVLREGPSAELAQRVMPAICEAASELNEGLGMTLVHRDLKPSNIIMTGAVPVIIDLGIARRHRDGDEPDTVRFGTRGYAAPEQFGFGQTSVRSDVYSLGMLALFCCTGKQPTGPVTAESLSQLGLPEALASAIARATAFDPVARFADARAFSQALGGGSNVPATPRPKLKITVPHLLGRAWNVCVIATWAFFVAGCFANVVDPRGIDATYPTWFLVLEYPGMLGVLFTTTAYLLLDRRRLRQRFKVLQGVRLRRELVVCLAVDAAVLAITVLVAQFVVR